MSDQTEMRIVLWGRHKAELAGAQTIDAEVEKLEASVASKKAEAAECRRRAGYIKQAAEIIGRSKA